MFDRIAHLLLFSPELAPLLSLYRDHLGFEEQDRTRLADDSSYHELWRLPEGPLEVVTLGKPHASGGELRLVHAPQLPQPPGPRTMGSPGPFALDLYVRDLAGLHRQLVDAGHRFRSEPVTYELFGTGFHVDEVLLEAPLGFVHALVEYLPDRHRCLLAEDPDAQVSEFVAAITVVEDVEEALTTLRDVLGGQVYFDQHFRGNAVEQLIGLPAGSSFRTVLVRGAARRNARAEVMATVADAPASPARVHPYLLHSLPVDDIEEAIRRLGDRHPVVGPLTPSHGPHAQQRVATVWTTWGAALELVAPR